MKWVYMKGISIEAQYLYRKAEELVHQEQYATALRYFKQAVFIAPVYAKAICEMANCEANLGNRDEAVRLYNRAITIDPALEEARKQRDQLMAAGELNNNPQGIGLSYSTVQ
ncbi:MAG TPA: tetratricopeptide repeat protein [Methanoregula sp.]|jgi:tetratricopeptide (TPR) repeat protein|nr:tetratricopeptide repeat protein [Methanoregula sp.]